MKFIRALLFTVGSTVSNMFKCRIHVGVLQFCCDFLDFRLVFFIFYTEFQVLSTLYSPPITHSENANVYCDEEIHFTIKVSFARLFTLFAEFYH